MSKHTPGPWFIVDGNEFKTTDIVTVESENNDGSLELWTVASVNHLRPHWKENRKLISAAPDLLETLEHILENDYFDLSDDSIKMAKAAIAKAKGEI